MAPSGYAENFQLNLQKLWSLIMVILLSPLPLGDFKKAKNNYDVNSLHLSATFLNQVHGKVK